jgi:hypothetical protein
MRKKGKVGLKLNIEETAIYNLLCFITTNFYEKYKGQLISAANRYGPAPIEFNK